MKKRILILLATVVLALIACGCNGSSTHSHDTDETVNNTEEHHKPDAAIQEQSDASGNGQTVSDQNGLRISYLGFNPDNDEWGPEVQFYAENSSDKDYYVQTRKFSVNGIPMMPMLSVVISSGESKLMPLYIFRSDLTFNEIADVNSIEFVFFFWDNSKTAADGVESEAVFISLP